MNQASRPTHPPSAKHSSSGFITSFCVSCALCVTAALCWSGEEPSRIRTVIVALAVNTLAAIMLLFAKRARFIDSSGWWMAIFGCKLILSVMFTMYAWYEPLAPDLLRVPEAVQGLQDSNLYDYHAMEAARHGILQSWHLLNFTWLSFGVTGYLALIYTLFGSSIAYVSMCNALLSITGLVMLTATVRRLFGTIARWDLIALAAFIPSIAYYDATPAKEPLTNAFFFLALYALINLNQHPRIHVPAVLIAAGSLGALALVRANVAFMLVIANAWPLIKRFGLIRSLVAIMSCAILAAGILVMITGSTKNLASIFNLKDRIVSTGNFVQERADAGESGLKQVVAEQLAPRGLLHLLALSPLRAAIWFYLPYPLITPTINGLVLPPTLLYQDRLNKPIIIHELAFSVTGWLLVFSTPFLLCAIIQFSLTRPSGLGTLLFNIIIPAMIIGNLMFVMGRRYRILIEPLVFAIVLIAWRHKGSRQIAPYIWIFMTAGVALVTFLRS